MRTFTASTLTFLLVLAPTVPARPTAAATSSSSACRPRPPRLMPRTGRNWQAGRSDEKDKENC
ncbi:hypothetical protein ACPA9J_01770 [Pseudomonas aeruginosa]